MQAFMKPQSDADKQALLEAYQNTAVYLSKLATLLRSKRFENWYFDTSSRFEWATVRLFTRLKMDLMFQIRQGLRREAKAMDDIERLQEFVNLIDEHVDWICRNYDVNLRLKDKAFTVPRGVPVETAILDFMSRRDRRDLMKDKASADSFYMWNGIGSLAIYAQARDTLSQPTGHPQFERILSDMDEGYLLAGYPHDLLAHDAADIRSGKKVKALLMKKGYCSTFMFKTDDPIGTIEEGRLIHFKPAA